jgi:hypothetical protein
MRLQSWKWASFFLCASKSYDSTCYASAMIEMGEYCCVLPTPIGFDVLCVCSHGNEFLCASKSYHSTCYASAMIEMGEYCCVLPTPIGFDMLCVCSHGNGRVFVCFQILSLDLLCVCNDRDGRVLWHASNSYWLNVLRVCNDRNGLVFLRGFKYYLAIMCVRPTPIGYRLRSGYVGNDNGDGVRCVFVCELPTHIDFDLCCLQ